MSRWRSWRDDLRRPDMRSGREELPFLLVCALVIPLVAQASDPGTAGQFALLVVAAAAFVLRGIWSWPPSELFALFVIVPVGIAVAASGRLEVSLFLIVVMVLYTSWNLGSTLRAALIAGVSVATTLAIAISLDDDTISWPPWVAANLFTFVLGRNLHRQRMLIDELEATREALADAAVAEERRRIARELHDLAGHTLAGVVLHVTGARHVLRRDPDEAERALLEAERVGRAGLDQIRTVAAALRTTERGTDPPLADSADLAELVEEYRRAGLTVRAGVPDPAAGFDGPVGTALHRIAREALANVARHAPANTVDLTVDAIGGGTGERRCVRLVVADHGHRPADVERVDPRSFGLVGMTERARALGGELSAGPSIDGWRVEAVLPLAVDPAVPS